MSKSPQDTSNRQQMALLEGLRALFRDGILADVVLVSGQMRIPCHRVILAASSQYFRAMFTNPVKESREGEVDIRDMEPENLRAIVNFLYTGELTVTDESVQDIFMAATMWGMPFLVDMCGDHMARQLCLQNCADVYSFATHFTCKVLIEKSNSFILENFSEILLNNDRLYSLPLQPFLELVSSDMLCVSNEEIVYEAVMQWVRQDIDNKKEYLPDLFKEIRLPLISKEFIELKIKTEELLKMVAFCRDRITIYEELRDTSNISNLDDESTEMTGQSQKDIHDKGFCDTPRLGMYNRKMLVFAGGANGPDERSFTAFDPKTKCNYFSIKPHPTFDFKYKIEYYRLITTEENEIYFIGGIFFEKYHFQNTGQAMADVFQYSMKDVQWIKRSSMNYPRCCFSACCKGNLIYVLGGKSSYPRGESLDSLECYVSESDVWQQLSSAPIPLIRHSATICKEAMFVFGGMSEDEQYLDTVLRYGILSDDWTLVKTEMVKPRADLTTITYGENIYLLGGASEHQNVLTIEIYNPAYNRWTYGNDFPEERKNYSAVLMDDSIYVCGGVRHLGSVRGRRSRQVESRDLYRYDIEKKSWTKEVRQVQFGMFQICTVAHLNIKFLQQSDISSA